MIYAVFSVLFEVLTYVVVCRLGGDTMPSPACNSYLVDPASSLVLVSKTIPCKSKYKHRKTVNGSLDQL